LGFLPRAGSFLGRALRRLPGNMHMFCERPLLTGQRGSGIDLDTSVIGSHAARKRFQEPRGLRSQTPCIGNCRPRPYSGRMLADETLAVHYARKGGGGAARGGGGEEGGAGGRGLIQTMSVHMCSGVSTYHTGADRRRLSRVLDYIAEHLEGYSYARHLASIAR